MRRPTIVATAIAHLVGPGKLKVINGRLAYSTPDQRPLRLTPDELKLVVCYGKVTVTGDALEILFKHQVEVVFLTPAGRDCRGRLLHARSSTLTLRLAQLQAFSQPELVRHWAIQVVAGKIHSQIDAARHFQRHGIEAKELLAWLRQATEQCSDVESLDQLRGLEGSTSAAWFQFFGRLVKDPWQWNGRNRRPPKDPLNALLSLGYTCLTTRATAFAEAAGLEVNLGGLHAFRPGRPSLACDLIEPLRVPAVDRWVVFLCNKDRLKPDDFIADEKIGIRLKPEKFPHILHSWEEHWHQAELEKSLHQWIDTAVTLIRRSASIPTDEMVTDEAL